MNSNPIKNFWETFSVALAQSSFLSSTLKPIQSQLNSYTTSQIQSISSALTTTLYTIALKLPNAHKLLESSTSKQLQQSSLLRLIRKSSKDMNSLKILELSLTNCQLRYKNTESDTMLIKRFGSPKLSQSFQAAQLLSSSRELLKTQNVVSQEHCFKF